MLQRERKARFAKTPYYAAHSGVHNYYEILAYRKAA